MDEKDPHSDEHIEDLLSQLQGIFGKLSKSEEEESHQKLELPPKEAPVVPTAPVMDPSPLGAPTLPILAPQRDESAPPVSLPALSQPLSEFTPMPVTPSAPVPPEPVSRPADITPLPDLSGGPPVIEDDGRTIPTVIYYPMGRESDARALSEKLETMAPKFTKIAFQLRVMSSLPYDLKGDLRETLLNRPVQATIRAVFFIVERPLDEFRKKMIVSQLEPRSIYFQEVPLIAILKKAFYTDLLLGLVFFFDGLKTRTGDPQ